jgi:predicted metal-binding protein
VIDGQPVPGAALHAALVAEGALDGVSITAVECLSNCTRGCTVALRGGPARWTYVYGNLSQATDVAMIRQGAAQYGATANGLVPWRERSEHFRKNCIARLPPIPEAPRPESAIPQFTIPEVDHV